MCFQNAIADRQSQASTLGLRADKRLEYYVLFSRWYPGAIIFEQDFDLAISRGNVDPKFLGRRVRLHGIQSIQNEIEKNLLQLIGDCLDNRHRLNQVLMRLDCLFV